MISQHARLARTLAEQLELPGAVREGVGAAYEQWDGRGWPGTLKAGAIPVAARIAQLAEFMEVAHRVGGVAGATALARRRSGRDCGSRRPTPRSASSYPRRSRSTPDPLRSGSTTGRTGDRYR